MFTRFDLEMMNDDSRMMYLSLKSITAGVPLPTYIQLTTIIFSINSYAIWNEIMFCIQDRTPFIFVLHGRSTKEGESNPCL